MKTDNGLAIALFAVVIGGAVALAIANDITAPICDAAKIKSMAPDKIEFGCLEFWLNRYQTMLVGVAALVSATATIAVMRWQTNAERERRRRIALMRALVELRPFRDTCEDLLVQSFGSPDPDTYHPKLPTLRFAREPELIADLNELEAAKIFHFALIVESNRDQQELVDSFDDVTHSEYFRACAAWNAEEAFDLINQFAEELDWASDPVRPSDDDDVAKALEIWRGLKGNI